MKSHRCHTAVLSIGALLIISLLGASCRADGGDAKKPADKTSGVVGGLMTDFKKDSMLVVLDGDDEPTKFAFGPGITQDDLARNRHIFPVDRVNVKWKLDGETKTALAIEKVAGKATGVIKGKVLKVYNNFWVSIKPDGKGLIEGFALAGPGKSSTPGFDTLKKLQRGDMVAIKYATDFERHRIQEIEVKTPAAK